MRTVVQCAACKALLAEPPDIATGKRRPCPDCGSTARTFSASATVTLGLNVTTSGVVTKRLEDAGFSVAWLRLSEGGAWMVRVFDRDGAWLDGAIADDPEEAILAVSERLLPRSEPAE
jgi:ribosomal protein S27E